MVYRVDTVQVPENRLAEYLALVKEHEIPILSEAGASFVSCRTSPPGVGNVVEVQVTWSCADFAAWNVIRKTLVLDPRWHRLGAVATEIRRGGTRRFLVDA